MVWLMLILKKNYLQRILFVCSWFFASWCYWIRRESTIAPWSLESLQFLSSLLEWLSNMKVWKSLWVVNKYRNIWFVLVILNFSDSKHSSCDCVRVYRRGLHYNRKRKALLFIPLGFVAKREISIKTYIFIEIIRFLIWVFKKKSTHLNIVWFYITYGTCETGMGIVMTPYCVIPNRFWQS